MPALTVTERTRELLAENYGRPPLSRRTKWALGGLIAFGVMALLGAGAGLSNPLTGALFVALVTGALAIRLIAFLWLTIGWPLFFAGFLWYCWRSLDRQ